MKKTLLLGLFTLMFAASPAGVFADNDDDDDNRRGRGKGFCVDLAIGITAVDGALDNQGVQFPDLGTLYGSLRADQGLFDSLNAILDQSVGITFRNTDQVHRALNRCGLVPHAIDQIND